ncbi:MAG: hypothetical protein NUW09_07610, partial [Deltaproteobacteria bacterium]|nr:hypothetical protein [Deltaproteobacteria bacterium]
MFQCSLAAAAFAADGIRNRIEKDTRLFSIEVRDADVSDVLRALAEQSGFNIILGEGAEGKISLSFKDIAFKDALEIIIKARGLGYTVQNNVFWVGKQVDLSDEQVMVFVRLNYADPAVAVQQLKGALSAGGTAVADARTNSVILKDLPKNIEAVRRLLVSIDIQTPQVLIEARIVEATTSFTRQLGVQWGGAYTTNNIIRGSAILPSSSGGRNFAVNLPAAEATSGLGMVIGSISSKLALDIELTAAESKGELKIVSRPKIATLNNKPATIHSGLTFRVKLQGAATTAGTTGASATSGLQEIKTGIDLSVTPQISSDGFILLNINTNKSDPDYSHTVDGIPGVSEKSASTHVLIKDGETIVIGGLYKTITSE